MLELRSGCSGKVLRGCEEKEEEESVVLLLPLEDEDVFREDEFSFVSMLSTILEALNLSGFSGFTPSVNTSRVLIVVSCLSEVDCVSLCCRACSCVFFYAFIRFLQSTQKKVGRIYHVGFWLHHF